MVDYQNGVDPSAAPVDAGAADGAKPGFLNTRTGKLVVGGVALVLVLLAIGAALYFFMFGGAVDDSVNIVTNPTPGAAASGSTSETAEPVNPAERSLASTFTFRNVFAPTVKKTYEATATTTTSTETASAEASAAAAAVPANTLFLQSIISEDGVPKAVFIWNDTTYTVGEGEQVGDTPWKVLQINSDSALMLYGDSQVTLSVGQGVGK